jgi:hypothetical protein
MKCKNYAYAIFRSRDGIHRTVFWRPETPRLPCDQVLCGPTLDANRRHIPCGLIRFVPADNNHPHLVELWINPEATRLGQILKDYL